MEKSCFKKKQLSLIEKISFQFYNSKNIASKKIKIKNKNKI